MSGWSTSSSSQHDRQANACASTRQQQMTEATSSTRFTKSIDPPHDVDTSGESFQYISSPDASVLPIHGGSSPTSRSRSSLSASSPTQSRWGHTTQGRSQNSASHATPVFSRWAPAGYIPAPPQYPMKLKTSRASLSLESDTLTPSSTLTPLPSDNIFALTTTTTRTTTDQTTIETTRSESFEDCQQNQELGTSTMLMSTRVESKISSERFDETTSMDEPTPELVHTPSLPSSSTELSIKGAAARYSLSISQDPDTPESSVSIDQSSSAQDTSCDTKSIREMWSEALSDIIRLEDQIFDLNQDSNRLKEELKLAKAENSRMINEIDKDQGKLSGLEFMRQRIQELETEIETYQQEIETYKQEQAARETQAAKVGESAQSVTVTESQQTIQQLRDLFKARKGEAAANERVASLERELTDAKIARDEANLDLQGLKVVCDKLKKQLDQFDKSSAHTEAHGATFERNSRIYPRNVLMSIGMTSPPPCVNLDLSGAPAEMLKTRCIDTFASDLTKNAEIDRLRQENQDLKSQLLRRHKSFPTDSGNRAGSRVASGSRAHAPTSPWSSSQANPLSPPSSPEVERKAPEVERKAPEVDRKGVMAELLRRTAEDADPVKATDTVVAPDQVTTVKQIDKDVTRIVEPPTQITVILPNDSSDDSADERSSGYESASVEPSNPRVAAESAAMTPGRLGTPASPFVLPGNTASSNKSASSSQGRGFGRLIGSWFSGPSVQDEDSDEEL
ncbi:hypothetical protein OIO90_005892 [Microbotryomycetes sp. JL221]|nr:hypothetical protein OIO90_005892 [Microbotryomycetes sp. JL221]